MTSIEKAFADEDFQTAAQSALGDIAEEEPLTVEPLDRGSRKQTAVVRYADRDPVVLQLCEERTWLRTESTLLAAIHARTDVPVPPVLSAGEAAGVAYMVTAYVPGEDLHTQFAGLDTTTQEQLARTFGTHLATLHEEFRFDGYGSLVVDAGELTAWRESAWLAEYGRGAVERLPEEFDQLRDSLQTQLVALEGKQASEAHLFPWDFRPGNALVTDGQITAILDWEAPLAASSALSVAKAEYLVADWYVTDPEPLRRAFRDGYESVRPYPDPEPAHRVAAIADSAVDSSGTVTNPGYPELDRDEAINFHREALADLL